MRRFGFAIGKGEPVPRLRVIATCLAAAILLAAVPPAPAYIILGSNTWDSSAEDWHSTFHPTDLTPQSSGGHPNGWLQISFPAITADPPPAGTDPAWYDMLYTPATNLFTGTWATNMWVQFDFWSSNEVANTLQVRWQSATNDYVWSYNLTPSSTQTWATFATPFADWTQWILGPGATQDKYLSDLATIDWIGVYIYRTGTNAQTYGLDNWDLMVPEPAEFLLLGAALVVSLWSLRRQRRNGRPRAN